MDPYDQGEKRIICLIEIVSLDAPFNSAAVSRCRALLSYLSVTSCSAAVSRCPVLPSYFPVASCFAAVSEYPALLSYLLVASCSAVISRCPVLASYFPIASCLLLFLDPLVWTPTFQLLPVLLWSLDVLF